LLIGETALLTDTVKQTIIYVKSCADSFRSFRCIFTASVFAFGDAANARPENDGQTKLWVWKMQEWKMTDKNYGVWKMQDGKMTDKLLANCEHNYGVWKMQEYKSI